MKICGISFICNYGSRGGGIILSATVYCEIKKTFQLILNIVTFLTKLTKIENL